MRQIEPKFDYPHNPNHGNSQGNDSQGKTQSAWKVGPLRGNNNPLTDMNPLQGPESVVIRHENKQTPPPPPPKKAKKYGSSLGWGWFQAFSLFLTLLFLVGSGILLWMMIGNESIHEGPPKYVLSNDGQVGDVVLNPQLVGSMVAGDPKNMNQRPGQNEQILNDPLKSKTVTNTGVGNIELLGESESDKVTATPTSQKSEKEQQADDIADVGNEPQHGYENADEHGVGQANDGEANAHEQTVDHADQHLAAEEGDEVAIHLIEAVHQFCFEP